MPTIDQAVAGYIALRDKKKLITDRHKEELATINSSLTKLENWLHRELNRLGAESTKTAKGTVYLSKVVRAKVEDWNALIDFAVENNLTELLAQQVSKDAVESYLESTGELPPGVSLTPETFARVRK